MRTSFIFIAVASTASLAASAAEPSPAGAKSAEWFEKKIRPILVGHCYACHSADTKPAGDLRVDDRNGLLMGGDSGPAMVPGDPGNSLLIRRLRHANPNRRMPKEGKPLSDEEIGELALWIRHGAPWPGVKVPASLGQPKSWYEPLKKEHWAWQPLNDPVLPVVHDPSWPSDDLDRFVLAGLEKAGLSPVRDAEKATLIRRVSFDLTGLPPTPEQTDAFLADRSPDAFAKVVNRLLASPGFGERWGRHWLDVARYGESTGPSRNIPYPHAWRYRDYVIEATNRDLPFDRFVTEQIAGDLLPASSPGERDRLATATGFLALGVKDVNQRFKVRFQMDNVDDQIDAVTRSLLALTVSCARCHDHKFDPIPITDYYALAGIFTSTENCAGVRNKMGGAGLDYYDPNLLVTLSGAKSVPPEQVKGLEAKVAEAKKAWDAIRGTREGLARGPDGFPKQRPYRLAYEKLRGELLELTDPGSRGYALHAVRDAKQVGDTQLRIRGEAEQLGPSVPRGFLTAFDVPGASKVSPAQSGRLELARWLTSPKNPLTPRVAVNRVWQHLFGRGIVTTVDNFGTTGDAPSHPELLDHLASGFVRDGWSVKRLVRRIVLSHAYRLGGDSTPAHMEADPENQLLWRHSPRRLESEEVRDAILSIAGTLSPTWANGLIVRDLKMIELRDNGPEARMILERTDASTVRSVYLPLLRGLAPRALEPFDPVEQTLVTGRRETTTVPSQALFLLNSSFVRRQSLALAERLLEQGGVGDDSRVRSAYRFALGRVPSSREVDSALAFLADYASLEPGREGLAPPQVALASAVTERPSQQKAPQPANPDEVDQTGEPVVEAEIRPKDTRTAAWLAFTQALFGSAEFRYVR
ncbi:MAG: PSD1 and planctomycete cytochrome C domain-containing protein [Isosphaeraceae bacterium]